MDVEEVKQLGGADERKLHHLPQPVDHVALVLRADKADVQERGERRVKRAHPVLEPAVDGVHPVDARLDAHRRVDERQERRWHPDVRHPAAVHGRGKADDIQDDAAANGEDGLPPVEAKVHQRLKQCVDGGDGLVLLLAGQDKGAGGDGVRVKVGGEAGAVERRDGRVDDEEAAGGRAGRAVAVGEGGVGGVQQVRVHFHRVLHGQLKVVCPRARAPAAGGVMRKDVGRRPRDGR